MLRLRRLKVHKFRAVAPGTEVRFHDAYNVLLGKNGTGKTTLLELVSMALRFGFNAIANEALDIEVDLDGELAGAGPCSVAMRRTTEVPTTEVPSSFDQLLALSNVNLQGKPGTRKMLETGQIRVGAKHAAYTFDGDTLRVESGDPETSIELQDLPQILGGEFRAALVKLIFFDANLAAFARPIEPHLPRGSGCLRFDESLSIFQMITERLVVEVLSWLREATQVRDLFILSTLLPESVRTRVRAHVHDSAQVTALTLRHDELPFLQKLVPLLGFESATLQLSLQNRSSLLDNLESYTFGKLSFLFTRPGGRDTISHELLSYGQKRMLALYYYLEANPDHIVADELVNGLHHEWIERVVEEIGERQAFLSSQNPLLLDYLTFDSPQDAERAFVLCELDDAGHMVWRNMTPDEARAFYSAYDVGIQHVGEILRGKGFW